MKLVNRYLLKDLLKPTLVATFILVAIIWLMQSLRFMDYIINKGLDVGSFIILTVLLIPSLLIGILPLAYFAACCFAYKRLVEDSEADALFSSGVSRFQLLKPALIGALFISLIGYAISFWALPMGKLEFKRMQQEVRNSSSVLVFEEGTFNKLDKNLTIYVKEREGLTGLKGLMVHQADKGQDVTWMAEYGRLIESPSGFPILELKNGIRQEIKDNSLNVLEFESHQLEVVRKTKTVKKRMLSAEERTMTQLKEQEGLPERIVNRFEAEYQRRLLWPLTPIPFAFIAFLFIVRAKRSRTSLSPRVAMASVVACFYQILLMLANSMAQSGQKEILYGQWGILVVFIVMGFIFLRDKRKVVAHV